MYAESSTLLYIESLRTVPGVLGMNEVSALKLYAWANLLTLLHSNQPKLQRVLAVLSATGLRAVLSATGLRYQIQLFLISC